MTERKGENLSMKKRRLLSLLLAFVLLFALAGCWNLLELLIYCIRRG